MIGSRARGDLLHDPAVPGKGWEGCHDLTGGRALVCIAGELRDREAARAARAARRRGSWLFRLARRVRDWRACGGIGAGPPALPRCQHCKGPMGSCSVCAPPQRCEECNVALPYLCITPLCDSCLSRPEPQLRERLEDLGPGGLLAVARAAALRDHQPELAAAIHTVLLLDMTGSLGEMAALVAAVRAGFEAALGDLPRVDIN